MTPKITIVSNWMKKNVISIHESATILDAANLLLSKKVGMLPVLNDQGSIVGEVTINDIIKTLLPDFFSLVENIDFIKDFGALKKPDQKRNEKIKQQSVTTIMEPPIFVDDQCSLIRAVSVMRKHNIRDLPIVRDGQLVGLVSWVDLGRAFISAQLSIE